VTDADVVMEAAAAFLAVWQRSVGETRTRLLTLGYAAPLVEEVIKRLIGLGYLDDEQFARAWVESRDRARPRGEHALRLELGRKGIERATIDGVLAERNGARPARDPEPDAEHSADPSSPDRAAAVRLLQRRARTLAREPDPRKRRAKGYALLARNGFDPEICREVAATLTVDAGSDATGTTSASSGVGS
jgi:SOS response regulatory protein OraA/RecX